MKLVKMSLAAAVLLGASAFAVDNVKVSGDAKLYYNTTNATEGDGDSLFGQAESSADTALRIGVTGDLLKGVSFGATGYAVSTLGLENNLVANTWTGAHHHSGSVDDAAWMSELWLAATMGKTTAKIGRMELDTPLAFSEKWSVVANTFDAAVLINQDLPDTTLVGAWVGKGNGVNAIGVLDGVTGLTLENRQDIDTGTVQIDALGIDGIMATDGKFGTFAESGAYAAAIVNNSFKPLTAQAWYFNVANIADAYWLQADINCDLVKGLKIGAQYANMDPKGALKSSAVTTHLGHEIKDSSAYAVQLAYEGIQNLKVSAAYSSVDEDGTLKIANVATNNLGGAQSKLYTEAWWAYGNVGAPGADTVTLKAEYDAGFAKLGAYVTDVEIKAAGDTETTNVDEYTATVSKSFGPLDTTLAYVRTDVTDAKPNDMIQAYLTLNF
jgi:hypothetical protein